MSTLDALLSSILYGGLEDVALTPDFNDTLDFVVSVLCAAFVC